MESVDAEGARDWGMPSNGGFESVSMLGDGSEFLLNISGKSSCDDSENGLGLGIDAVLIAGRDTAKAVEIDAGTVDGSAVVTSSSRPSLG